MELWPLVRSFGKDVRVSGVELEDATLNVVRRTDETFSYEEVLKRLRGDSAGSKVLVNEVRIRQGKVVLFDHSRPNSRAGSAIALDQIDAVVRGLGAGRTTSAQLKGAFASKRQNVTVDAKRSADGKLRGRLSASDVNLQALRGAFPAGLRAS